MRLPGHFLPPLPAARVSLPGSSPSSSHRGPCQAWGFQGQASAFCRLGGSEAARQWRALSVLQLHPFAGTRPPSSPPRSCCSRLVEHFATQMVWWFRVDGGAWSEWLGSAETAAAPGRSRGRQRLHPSTRKPLAGTVLCCQSFPTSPGSPPLAHSGQAVLVTTSLREAGWVVTAVVSLTIASTALEQRSVSASAIFKFPLEAMARSRCAIAKLALAVFGGLATTTFQAGVGPLLWCQHTNLAAQAQTPCFQLSCRPLPLSTSKAGGCFGHAA